jgi:FkbM family methyltransferase
VNDLLDRVRNRLTNILFYKFGIPRSKDGIISKAAIKKYLPTRPVIIDCGAHDGWDSIELADTLKGEVHAFEAVPYIFERLKENTQHYRNIYCHPIALSDEDGSKDFYVSEGASDMSSSLLEPKEHLVDHPGIYFKNKISVKGVTLDTWAINNKLEKIDLLWLDMQGAELGMLKASERILSTVKAIHTEVSMKETYKGVPLYAEYRHYLEEKGFKVMIEEIPMHADMGNVLFIRN